MVIIDKLFTNNVYRLQHVLHTINMLLHANSGIQHVKINMYNNIAVKQHVFSQRVKQCNIITG